MNDFLKRIETLGRDGSLDELAGWLAHDDWQVRRSAAEAFVARASSLPDESLGPIVRLLFDGVASEDNAGLRSASLEALTRFAPRITGHLLAELESGEEDVRVMLAPVVGETGCGEAVLALTGLARGANANVATAAIIGLGKTNCRDAVQPLIHILGGNDFWVVFPAIESLGVLGDPSAVAPLASRLDDELLGSTALAALVQIGDPRAAEAIAHRLFGGGPLRIDFVDALSRIATDSPTPVLAGAARASVIGAFRAHYDPDRFDELAELSQAGSWRTESALEALGWTGDARALPVLLVALGRPRVQASAAIGLATLLADRAVVAELQQFHDRLSTPIREELARALAASAPVEAAALLADLLTCDDDATVREAAALAGDLADRLPSCAMSDPVRVGQVVERLAGSIQIATREAMAPLARLASKMAAAVHLDSESVLQRGAELIRSPDVAARLAGAELVASMRGATELTRDVIASALRETDPFTRHRAIEIAAAWDPAQSRSLFDAAMDDEEPLVRRTALAALARFDDGSSTAALKKAQGDWHGLVAADALAALAGRQDGCSVPELLAASRSGRALLRCVAIECLARLDEEPAGDRVLEAARSDPDFEVRRAAVAAVHGRPCARSVAAVALEDSHHVVRHAAVRLAGQIGDPEFASRLVDLAESDDSDAVRGESIAALASIKPEEALDRIGPALLAPSLAPYAVRALEIIGDRHIELLRSYRDGGAAPRTVSAIDTLGLLGQR